MVFHGGFANLCRFLTGQVDKRTLEKFEREARAKNRETWYLSWALDLNPEEREKVGGGRHVAGVTFVAVVTGRDKTCNIPC